jgi:phage baseplate assembly protein V
MDYDTDTVFPRDTVGRGPNVRNMFRQGKVIERIVDDTQCSVRVQWHDKRGLISRPLPVKQFGSKGTSAFWCPKIGDDVNVTMLPNSDGGEGFVDGSFYNTSNPPPVTNPDQRHITFADGTIIDYTEANARTRTGGSLSITTQQPITITCEGIITIQATKTIFNGDVDINGTLVLEGIIMNTHKHGGVESGSAKTTGPEN